jgi:hypothetical protein
VHADQTRLQDDSQFLEGLMALAGGQADACWNKEELAFIWRHQLAAPLESELGGFSRDAAATDRALAAAAADGNSPVRSIQDLLDDPAPPLEVLQLLKDFARCQRADPGSGYPQEVAVALYFAAIAMALACLNQRITRMDDPRLCRGLEWMTRRSWIDPKTRALATEAMRRVGCEQRGASGGSDDGASDAPAI